VTVDLNLFYAETRDRITGWPPVNLSRTVSSGGDMNAVWRLGFARWWFNGTYAAVESRSPSYPGRQVPYVPRWLAATGADLRIGEFRIVPVVRYVSRRFTTLDNTAALSLSPSVRVTLSGDVMVRLMGKDLTFGLVVENLLDAQGSSYPGYPLPGRSVLARLALDLFDHDVPSRTP
jgi:hypothetical protein